MPVITIEEALFLSPEECFKKVGYPKCGKFREKINLIIVSKGYKIIRAWYCNPLMKYHRTFGQFQYLNENNEIKYIDIMDDKWDVMYPYY